MKRTTFLFVFMTVLLIAFLGVQFFGAEVLTQTKTSETHRSSALNFRDTTGVIVSETYPLEWPRLNSGDTVIQHTGFSLVYSEPHEQATWVAYRLTAGMTRSSVKRSNNFRVDPKISTGSAEHADYRGSGFDRGHLAPAGDMGWSEASMSDSFYYSNMSPQRPSHNRGVWKRLEELVRDWAVAYDSLYVVTGPILKDSLPTIGPNEVAVPEAYYKAILRASPSWEGVAFVVPNEGSKAPLTAFALSIDSLQQLAAIDFFYQLEDSLEQAVEQRLCKQCWEW